MTSTSAEGNMPVCDSTKEETVANFEMRPQQQNTFKGNIIKEIVNSVLQEVLSGKLYSSNHVDGWTKDIADRINLMLKDLMMTRYKHIVQVIIAQQTGAGCKYIAKCRWDAQCDMQISSVYSNETIACVATVFGIYLY